MELFGTDSHSVPQHRQAVLVEPQLSLHAVHLCLDESFSEPADCSRLTRSELIVDWLSTIRLWDKPITTRRPLRPGTDY